MTQDRSPIRPFSPSPEPRGPVLVAALLAVLVLGGGALTGQVVTSETGSAAAPDGDAVVARVGSRTITAAEVEAELARRSGGRPGAYVEASDRRRVLDEMVERSLLVEAALAADYDRDPAVRKAWEDLLVLRFRQEELDRAVEQIVVTPEEIESFYAENRELYRLPERRRAAVIKVPATGEGALESAEDLRQRALELPASPADFGALAAEASHDRATRYRGGDMGYLDAERAYVWPPEVLEAAFALERVGDLSPVIEAGGFYWLVRLSESESVVYRSLDEVAATIRHELRREKARRLQQELIERLRSEIAVEVSDDAAERIEPPPAQRLPRLPDGGSDPGAAGPPGGSAPGGTGGADASLPSPDL